jgi:hypothetical protein
MNEIIKDVLEERAEHARTPHVDAARLIRSGRRRRNVRRGIGTVSVAAIAASAIAIAPTIVDGRGGTDSPASGQPATGPGSSPPAWADSDGIHLGDVEVPRPSDTIGDLTYAATAGYLAYGASDDSAHGWGIYVLTPDGEEAKVGSRPESSPVGDGEAEVAWLERTGKRVYVVVLREASGHVSRLPLGPDVRGVWLQAVDDGVVYYGVENRYTTWSVSPGADPAPTDLGNLLDHRGGVAAVYDGPTRSVVFKDERGRPISRVTGLEADKGRLYGREGVEDAVFLSQTAGDPMPVLVDVSTGELDPIEVEGFAVEHASFVGDQLVLVVTRDSGDGWESRVMACTPSGEDCQTVDEQAATGEEYYLPDDVQLSSRLSY